MYQRYYGLSEKPFNLTPDTEFFYQSFTHKEALDVLQVAIKSGDGFIKVTGEVGTGKTLLCRKLLNLLDTDFDTIYIPNPYMKSRELLDAVLVELGVGGEDSREDALTRINGCLLDNARNGRATVILLDEAQSMTDESLEAIRLLSNLETGKRKLVQIILFGQPELDVRLASEGLRQLRQRIMHHYQLQPLNRESIACYLQHRISSAGYRGPDLFDLSAQSRLYKFSQGVPRVINVLCNKAMMLSYANGDFYINGKHIEAAAADSQLP
jgi:MSHA biogenesis protein MshM